MRALGLDIGSTSIKGAVLDLENNQVGPCVAKPFPAPIPGLPPSWVEVSPDEVIAQVNRVLLELLNQAPDANRLYCCGQMGGVILVAENGRLRSNYLSWRDQRSLQIRSNGKSLLQEARECLPQDVFTSLGNELHAGSLTTLLFCRARDKFLPSDVIPATISDFVLAQLCGTLPRMHVTHAIGLLDLHTSDWHREAFDLLDLSSLKLPELSRTIEPVGEFAHKGRSIQVFGAYGDQQCALYGAGLKPGELSLNISTGSQVSERLSAFIPGSYQSRMYFEGDYLNTITHLPAGRSLNVLFGLLTELAVAEGKPLEKAWENIVRLASEVTESDLDVALSFFGGPLGDSGHISHITTENLSVGQLFHAAFRSMAQNYDTCASRLNTLRPWRSLVYSGGLTQSVPLLKSMIESLFKLPCREISGEETLNGLLALART